MSIPLELGEESIYQADSAGRVLALRSDLLEFRLEDPVSARAIEGAADLYARRFIPVDRPLGDPSTLASLTLSAHTKSGKPVIIRGAREPRPAAEADSERFLSVTATYPIDDPTIVDMAAAINELPEAGRLLAMVTKVALMVEDRYRPGTSSVSRILSELEGDCTEHCRLFVTLSRAVGVPAREVAGFVYAGDSRRAFAPHRWCEVLIDGAWLAVDPTQGTVPAGVTHLSDEQLRRVEPPDQITGFEVIGSRRRDE